MLYLRGYSAQGYSQYGRVRGRLNVSTTMLRGAAGAAMGPELEKVPTGIPGLDQITGGGLPRGRVTLVAGSAGAGKTLLGLEFLVAGARQYGEPGVLVSFEESAEKVTLNVRSLGFDLDQLQQDGLFTVISFHIEPAEIISTGAFDLEPLFLILNDAIGRIGARRVVLDTVEVLFGAFGDDTTIRAELNRLARWLEERGVTAIMTGERGDSNLTRHGIEEYVSDCVIVLDHRVTEEISTRRLRVVKYRGSAHGTNEFPFLISARGFVVLPITSVALDYSASDERVSTGVDRLDHMLGGGVFRGSTTLVTGTAGTGKTSLGAHLVNAACARGERALWVLLEESPAQVLRNMRSVGLDLKPWAEAGLLRIWSARPSAYGLETHLAVLAQLIEEVSPSVAVLDGIAGLASGATSSEVTSLVARQFDLLKSREITTLATSLGHGDESSTIEVSSLVDNWLLLRNVEANGERNRLLFVLKSRGTAHSNQVREFVLTDHGIELVEVYVGPAGMLAGSARLAQEAVERDAEADQADEVERHRRELRGRISEGEAHLVAVQDQLAAERAEIERIDRRERRQAADAEADRQIMATRRWADAATANGGQR
jgi:circadian clock protein KaiC